jgi:DNA-binding NarL/FixJ family response regulator
MEVLLVDNQPRRAASLRAVTNKAFGDVRIRSACSLCAGLQQARDAEKLDLVVLELDLPGCSGIDALLRFRREFPSLRVLVVSANDPNRATAALEAGAVGYIPNTVSLLATAAAIRLIGEGGIYVPSSESLRAARDAGRPALGLTEREIDLLRLLAQGLNSKDVARQLDIAEESVQQQVHEILRALGASSRVEALVIAARRGLRLD